MAIICWHCICLEKWEHLWISHYGQRGHEECMKKDTHKISLTYPQKKWITFSRNKLIFWAIACSRCGFQRKGFRKVWDHWTRQCWITNWNALSIRFTMLYRLTERRQLNPMQMLLSSMKRKTKNNRCLQWIWHYAVLNVIIPFISAILPALSESGGR